MFILKQEEVENCQIQIQNQVLSGLKYLNYFFIFREAFNQQPFNLVLQKVRTLLEQEQFCILLKQNNGYSLWDLAPQKSKIISNGSPAFEKRVLDADFLDQCHQELADSVGPIANLICEEKLNDLSFPLVRENYIQTLANEIPDEQKARQFISKMSQYLGKE